MKVAILTGGGDAPGLNGIIEAVSRSLIMKGHRILGIKDGFEGIFEGRHEELELGQVEGIFCEPGTLLGTSNRSGISGREAEFLSRYRSLGADGMVVAGGDGTFAALKAFGSSLPLIGVPKTIDNDLSGTEATFGYDTACTVVAEAVDALRYSADAHRRVMVVETMGRTAGWIALGGGLASYADVILIPERPFSRPELLAFIRARQAAGRRGLLVVVSEGAAASGESPQVAFHVRGSPETERLGGVGERLARWIERETSWEARHVVLGHLQRARTPTTADRFLTLEMGVEVARMVEEGAWGQCVVVRRGCVARAPIGDLMGPPRRVQTGDPWVRRAQSLGLYI